MQTFSFSEQSKTPSSVTMQAEKRKPFFPAVKIHPKLIVGSAHDPLEHEADEVAGRIMRMPAPECHTCERDKLFRQKRDEDEEKILMKNDSGASSGIEAPPVVNEAIRSTGHPLDTGTRKFFEPRFGHDFKDVRIHTDDVAARSARAIHAQAYTIGNNIVFGQNAYRLDTAQGQSLLAHELTHIVQQAKGTSGSRIRRWSYGTGTPPHTDYSIVPAADKKTVESGMNLLKKVVDNPKDYPVCHRFFKKNCPGGTDNSLKDQFANAKLWLDNDKNVWASRVGANIAYTKLALRVGRWCIGGVLVHELLHRCGQSSESLCDEAIKKCGFRDVGIVNGKIVEK